MSQALPQQHPAVVLRSHYRHLRTLLAIAMFAVAGLTVAVVILATDDDTSISTAARTAEPQSSTATRPDESAVAQSISHGPLSSPATRPDESAVAQSIARQPQSTTATRPDESAVAQSISRQPQTGTAQPDRAKSAATETFFRRTAPEPTRPDESGVAQAISGR